MSQLDKEVEKVLKDRPHKETSANLARTIERVENLRSTGLIQKPEYRLPPHDTLGAGLLSTLPPR